MFSVSLSEGDENEVVQFEKCDRIWENPAYRENAQAAQCALLVPHVKKCQGRVCVIFISLPPPTEGKRKLPRRNKPSF